MDENKKVYGSANDSADINVPQTGHSSEREAALDERLSHEAKFNVPSHEGEVLDLKTHHMDQEGQLNVVYEDKNDANYYEEDRHDEHVNVADRDFPSAHDYNTHDLSGEPNTDVTRDGEAYGNFQPSDFDTREDVVLDPDQTRVENVEEIDPTVE